MKKQRIIPMIGLAMILLTNVGCSDPWDEYARGQSGSSHEPLLERLDQEPSSSEFVKLLRASGVDKLLDGTNAYTLFVPENSSLTATIQDLTDDPETLEHFVKNHIAVSTHRLNASADTVRLTMLSGKILDLLDSQIDGTPFVKADQAGADGIYHLISAPLVPRQSLWEYLQEDESLQSKFIVGLNEYQLYASAAEEDPEDIFFNNEFLRDVGDVRDETRHFTYFVLKDADFQGQAEQFLPYVNYRNDVDSSYAISQYHVVRDLLFDGAFSKENLPATLTSASKVSFPVDRSAIVRSVRLSNAWVHVLERPTLPLANKLVDIYIEGEQPWSFSNNVTASTFHRVRRDPYGQIFQDIMVQNHGVSNLAIFYQLPRMYTTVYDVYWRAVNDVQTNVFQQRLTITEAEGRPSEEDPDVIVFRPLYTFPYMNVELNDYTEVYIGEYTQADFDRIRAALQGAATTSNGQNTLVLDYLRFVPKLKTN